MNLRLTLGKAFKNKYVLASSILVVIALMFILAMAISNANETAGITYRAHVAYNGWMDWQSDGGTAGTTGESRRMEAIKIKLTGDMAGDVIYQTYVKDSGWQGEVRNSETSGTEGQSKAIQAIKIRLEGKVSEKYNIQYRVHMACKGWTEWVSNGAMAGSDTEGLRIEAIEIKMERLPEETTSSQYENNRGQVTELSDEEFAEFVAIIFCESGGESYEGKLAVANVILNRLYSGSYGSSLHSVLYAKNQFTPAGNGKLASEAAKYKAGSYTTKMHLECIEAAKEAMAGHNNIDDRNGFMTPSAYAKYASGASKKLVIGGHVFFKW